MSFLKTMQNLDAKWLIGALISTVAIGAVANWRVDDNATDIRESRNYIQQTQVEVNRMGNRVTAVETKLENIESTANQILIEVRKR